MILSNKKKNTMNMKIFRVRFLIGALFLLCFQFSNAQTQQPVLSDTSKNVSSGTSQRNVADEQFVIILNPIVCDTCIGSFAPEPGQYIISAWVKKEASVPTDVKYTQPQISIEFANGNNSLPTEGPFNVTDDKIIDGWQRIESKFTVPATATHLTIKLDCTSGSCLFDDIRVFPIDGSLKSYVYDPVTLRLVAELDERNYATFYEYDEEGKLVRVKKETVKGVMSIKENRDFTNKK